YASLGHFEHAMTSARDALRVARQVQHPPSLVVAQDYLGYVHLLHGDLQGAVPLLERALALATEQEPIHATTRASSRLAYVLALLDERERSLDILRRALDRYTTRVTSPVRVYGPTMASAYLAAGAYEAARAEIEEGLAAAADRHARGYLAPLQRLMAEIIARTGDLAGARVHLAEGLAIAVDQDMRPDVAHCHFALGQLCLRTGKSQDAQGHLAIATAMYREMGMAYWLERVAAQRMT